LRGAAFLLLGAVGGLLFRWRADLAPVLKELQAASKLMEGTIADYRKE
jgi:hypothetical protein